MAKKKKMKVTICLTDAETTLLNQLIERIRNHATTMLDDLKMIRDQGLYKEHGTFKQFVATVFDKSATWAYRQLQAVKVRKSIAPPPGKSIAPTSPNGDKMTEAQCRELAKAPEEDRQKVLDWATEKAEGAKLTARMLAQAVKEVAAAEPEESDIPEPEDPIARKLLPVFERAEKFNEAMSACTQLTKLCNAIKADEVAGVLFAGKGIAAQAIKDIQNVRHALKFAKPHAICPYCKGQGCEACNYTGWVGHAVYASAPEVIK